MVWGLAVGRGVVWSGGDLAVGRGVVWDGGV